MQIKINQADMAQIKRMLSDMKGMDARITKRAVDRTMGTVKTKVSSVARETLNIRKRDTDPSIGVRKYDAAKRSGAVMITGPSFPLSKFSPKQMATGVRVKIKKATGGLKVIPGAFIATMKSGHTGVFWREWHKFRRPNTGRTAWQKMKEKYRLPIQQLFTSSLPEVIGDDIPMKKILANANENLDKNLERELNYEMSKLDK